MREGQRQPTAGEPTANRTPFRPFSRPAAIVGLGAAEGGLAAVTRLLADVPRGSGLAFVLVGPARGVPHSSAAQALEGRVALRVREATQGMRVEPDTLYLAPAQGPLGIHAGAFQARRDPVPIRPERPIDGFLRSLARDQRGNAVAVILSGSGGDGGRGIREIKERGGMVMVQHPEDAERDAMPLAAIETGQADHVLPAGKLSGALLRYVDHNCLFDDRTSETDDYGRQIEEVRHLLSLHTDHDFTQYKPSTLLRRIHRRMGIVGVDDLDEYVHLLKDRPGEMDAFVEDLLICVTSFFRDRESWNALQREVLAPLVEGRSAENPMRVWVPACATGEEAYTLSMLLAELLGERRELRAQIFASDINNHALKIARTGVYPKAIEDDVAPERLWKFFVRENDTYRVTKAIRETVVFAAHDLTRDPAFLHLDLVSCRNLFIYLEPGATERILRRVHHALVPGGFLFLGRAETASRLEGGFEAVDARARIYRRVGGALLGARTLPSFRAHGLSFPIRASLRPPGRSLPEIAAELHWKSTSAVVLLLNDKHQVVYAGGDTERFLHVPAGEQRYTVYDVLRPGLPFKLRGAIQRLAEEPVVRFGGVIVQRPDGSAFGASGLVRKADSEETETGRIYVELEMERRVPVITAPPVPGGSDQDDIVRTLEHDLLETREALSATIRQLELTNEELRASHEEAMSVNEELQSGTEELEASQEELRSLNDELTTLNARLEDKLRELEAANNDLDNLISSTKIAVVFLDTDFRVRNFTPEAVDLFPLLRSDIGRPISDLDHRALDSDLLADAREVLKTLAPVQREVRSRDRRAFVRRLLPYRTQDNRIEGVVATFQDVTELKRVESELVAQRESLELVTDAMPALIAYVDHSETYRFVNGRYEQWFGIPREEVVGKTTREVLGERAHEQMRHAISEALAGERVTWEGDLAHRSGPPRSVRMELVPRVSTAEGLRGYYALIQDLTPHREAEAALRRSEREFRTIFELAGSGKAQWDPTTGRFMRVNRRFCMITGYAAKDLLEKTVTDLTHPAHRGQGLEGVREVLREDQEHWSSEARLVRSDGRIVWVLVTGSLFPGEDGDPMFAVATVQDITGRKEAEAALVQSEARFRALADNIAQLAWMADDLDVATWFNRRWYDYTGSTFEEMQGDGWKKVVHPEHLDRIVQSLDRAAREERPWEETFPLRRRDGVYRWFLSRAVPIRDESGRVIRWCGTNTDVTDQMELERALKRADRRKDEFLAMLAHELRNPLAPIRSGIDLLMTETPAEGETLKVMDEQVRHLTRLVDDLLDVSRITQGRIELRTERLRLQPLLRRVTDTSREEREGAGIALDMALADEPIWLEADPVRLFQVFENLLGNALKFTSSGGHIRVVGGVEGHAVVVSVEDDGAGIEPEQLSGIFDLFAQASTSPARERAGLGIGLTIVRSLVDLHGGDVTANSEGPGRGSRFVVRLPLAEPPRPPRRAPARTRKPEGRRVLVIDDNHSARVLLSRLIRTLGDHEVEVAVDGAEALEKAATFSPDLVLVDIGLPKMDGYEVARRLRRLEGVADAFLVALTGYGRLEDRQRSKDAGFDRHVVKPVGVDHLRELLAKASR